MKQQGVCSCPYPTATHHKLQQEQCGQRSHKMCMQPAALQMPLVSAATGTSSSSSRSCLMCWLMGADAAHRCQVWA